MRIDHTGEALVLRPPTVRGSYRIAAAIAETHSIESLSDTDSDFLRIELKGLDLKLAEPFRGKAPASLAQNSDVIEFNNPQLKIERDICAGLAACTIQANDAPSLFVAITPVKIGTTSIEAGGVVWLPATKQMSVLPQGESADVLRVILPEAK